MTTEPRATPDPGNAQPQHWTTELPEVEIAEVLTLADEWLMTQGGDDDVDCTAGHPSGNE